jgi:hypothetical protein
MADQMPEKKLHAPEIMRMSVRAAVFVNNCLFMAESEDGRDRGSIFFGDADLRVCTEAREYVTKPL